MIQSNLYYFQLIQFICLFPQNFEEKEKKRKKKEPVLTLIDFGGSFPQYSKSFPNGITGACSNNSFFFFFFFLNYLI